MTGRGEHLVRADRGFAVGGGLLARLISPAFAKLLDQLHARLARGGIKVTLPDGSQREIGFHAPGPIAIVQLNSWMALLRLGTSGSVGWYKAWTLGEWASPDPVALFELFTREFGRAGRRGPGQGAVPLDQRARPPPARQRPAARRSATSPRITTSATISTPPGSIRR